MGEINKLFILKINLRVILVMKERSIIYLLVWHYLISYLVIKTDGMKLYCGSNKFIWRYINCGLVFFVTLFSDIQFFFYWAHTFSLVLAEYRSFSIFKFLKSRNRKCPSFSLLRNLITRLHLKFLPKLWKNYKNLVFRGRPAATAL